MIRTSWRLCRSIARRNLGFTVGLLVLFLLSAAVSVLGVCFPVSAETSSDTFLAESGMPDWWFTAERMTASDRKAICAIDGVASCSLRLVYDTKLETADRKLFYIRAFSYGKDDLPRLTVLRSVPPQDGVIGVSLSLAFCDYNGLELGDRLTIGTPLGNREVMLESVVQTTESIECVRDKSSFVANYQFGYLYVENTELRSVTGITDLANQCMVFLEEGLSSEKKEEILQSICGYFGDRLLRENLFEVSDLQNLLHGVIDNISLICRSIPGIILFISLCFCFLFIRQIIRNQRKSIGLLRALGFSVNRVTWVYLLYTLLLCAAGLLLGIPLGCIVSAKLVGVFLGVSGIPTVLTVIRPLPIALYALVILAVGTVACLLGARKIAETDPCEAYGGKADNAVSLPPSFLKKRKGSAFFRLSAVIVLRNRKRLFMSSLCIAACVILMTTVFEGIESNNHSVFSLFDERLRYDILFCSSGDAETPERILGTDGVESVEPVVFFLEPVSFGGESKVALFNAISDSSISIYPQTPAGERALHGDGIAFEEMMAKEMDLSKGDTVTVNGVPLTVTEIVREMMFCVLYVSPETAEKLGHGSPNQYAVTLKEGADVEKVFRALSELPGCEFLLRKDLQKDNLVSRVGATQTILEFITVFAFLIGTMIVFNMVIVSINERVTEYAALRALGTPLRRFGMLAATENLIRLVLAFLIAFPVSRLLNGILFRQISTASQQFVIVRFPEVMLLSGLISFGYVIIGYLYTIRRIGKLDLIPILNNRE